VYKNRFLEVVSNACIETEYVELSSGLSQVENLRDSFEVIKSKSKPLAAYLFTNDEQLKKDFVQNISSGGMLINDTIIHVIALFLKFTQKR
jgi:acyl-CoA reductase-like NAD-dependent aldehyde dehydrogenase